MCGIELVVVVVAELRAEKGQIFATDEQRAGFACEPADAFLPIEFLRVFSRFVVTVETSDAHDIQPVAIHNFQIEVAHEVVGEIKSGEPVEQPVGVHRVGLIDYQETEFRVRVVGKLADGR